METEQNGDTREHILKVNFGLTWASIAKGATMLAAGIGALHAAGWLNVPASQAALNAVTVQLIETNRQVRDLQVVVRDLTASVEKLQGAVSRVGTAPKAKR